MKRSLLVLFLAVVMAVPTFAMEIVPKVGYLFSPQLSYKGESFNKDSSFSAGADFMFQIGKTDLYIGPGIAWNQKHKIDDVGNIKFGFTNIFAVAKYKFKAGDVNLYPFLQLGYGISNVDDYKYVDEYEKSTVKFNGGIYYGIGFGAEYKNIVFELLYGWNKVIDDQERDIYDYDSETRTYQWTLTYSSFRVQIGYKFSL